MIDLSEIELGFTRASLLTAIGESGAVRILVVRAAAPADELRRAHDLGPRSARLAAEATVATLLLGAYVKGPEKLTLQIALDRPQARYVGEVDPAGRFRGRLDPTELPPHADVERLDGLLFASKHDGEREVYRGITPVEHGSITAALRRHLVDSSQVHGVLGCDVQLEEGVVTRAAGVLIERLPPDPAHPSMAAADFVERYGVVEDGSIADLLDELAGGELLGQPVEVLAERPVEWGCSCSRDRMLAAVAGVGPVELRLMADEDGGADVDCHFCNTRYHIGADELRVMADELDAP